MPRITHPVHPDLLTRAQAAAALNISVTSLSRLVERGRFTEYRLPAGVVMLDRREVDKLAAEGSL